MIIGGQDLQNCLGVLLSIDSGERRLIHFGDRANDCFVNGPRTHVLRRALSELERDLGDEKFMRMHRSSIVNLERVQGLTLQEGGDYEVVLKTGARLALSRRFRKELEQRVEALGAGKNLD